MTKPLLHVNMAFFPSEMINTLPLSGSVSGGHLTRSIYKNKFVDKDDTA